MRQIEIIALVGPTCSGKTTMAEMLVKKGFTKLKTTTTRPKRAGSDDYNFVQPKEFGEMMRLEKLIEWDRFDGNFYGLEQFEVVKALNHAGRYVVVLTAPGAVALRKFLKKREKVSDIKVKFEAILLDITSDTFTTRMSKRMMDQVTAAVPKLQIADPTRTPDDYYSYSEQAKLRKNFEGSISRTFKFIRDLPFVKWEIMKQKMGLSSYRVINGNKDRFTVLDEILRKG